LVEGRKRPIQLDAVAAEQRLAEVAAAHESMYCSIWTMSCAPNCCRVAATFGEKLIDTTGRKVGIAQVLQSVHRELARELVDIERLVVLLEMGAGSNPPAG
jgi:hypothetical protein